MVPNPIKLALLAQVVHQEVPHLVPNLSIGIVKNNLLVCFSTEASKKDLDLVKAGIHNLDREFSEGVILLNGKHEPVQEGGPFTQSLVEILQGFEDEVSFQVEDTPAGVMVIPHGDGVSEYTMERIRNALDGMTSETFHRILFLDNGIVVPKEYGKRSSGRKVKKGVTKPKASTVSSLKELDDPARSRSIPISKDDILNLKILLGQANTIEDFISKMDTVGA
jgi:hypothetical protein